MSDLVVYCPACGRPVSVTLKVSKVDKNDSYLSITLEKPNPKHTCSEVDPTQDVPR